MRSFPLTIFILFALIFTGIASGQQVEVPPPVPVEVEAASLEEEADAVELPPELAPKQREEADEEPAVDGVNVDTGVSEEESTVKKIESAPISIAPVSADALRSKSRAAKPGQLGSSVMTRTEARTFNFTIPAPRGQLLDRNGYPLAQNIVVNYAALNFPFLGKDVTDEAILRYAGERIVHVNRLLGEEWDVASKRVIEHYRKRRWFPLIFSSVLTKEQEDQLQRGLMEGLKLHPVYQRVYPQNQTLSHVVGYVGKTPPQARGEIVNNEPLWQSAIGVEGLEQSFEADLRGTPGRINILYEADGSRARENLLQKPRPGHNVVTTIDLEMQNLCEKLLEQKVKRGAMVIMDVRNGDVMALASYPRYNPNDFIPRISQEKFSELINDPEKPLYPRAFRGSYPPASTYKVVTGLGFLDSGFVGVSDVYPCKAKWTIGELTMRNWNKKNEASMNLVAAITRSCNTWFYEVATYAGADSMSYMSTHLGLGQKTGLPLNEVPGFIPNNRYWLKNFGYSMADGEEAAMSIGQGMVETTPVQVARTMAAVGHGTKLFNARLVSQIQDVDHEVVQTFPPDLVHDMSIDPYDIKVMKKGMYDVVHAGNGTGKAAYHKITVAGKTGTGQWKPAQKQNIAWFAGFFPAKYPVYSFSVIYEGDPEEGVSGGKKAAPVIGAFLKEYLNDENYAEVKAASDAFKAEQQMYEPIDLGYREKIRAIYSGSGGGEKKAAATAAKPVATQAAPEPQKPKGRGLLRRIFGGN